MDFDLDYDSIFDSDSDSDSESDASDFGAGTMDAASDIGHGVVVLVSLRTFSLLTFSLQVEGLPAFGLGSLV